MEELHVDDAVLRYRRSGSGPVALFVHGFPLDHTMWSAQVRALEDVRACVAPDLRGFGRSSAAPVEVLTMERHALDLVALLDGLAAEQADVVALSMGGYVALALWALHPERVRSLTLVDTQARGDDEAGRARREAAAALLVEEGREAFAGGMLPLLVAESASVHVRARLRSMIEGTRYETIAAALEGMRVRADRRELLGTIDVPALVVCGEHDTLTPPGLSQEMADAIPGARLVLVPGVGHMAPMEAPAAVAGALRDFLPLH